MNNTPDNLAEEVLAHHGILGMKWGVRRYQNKDGSLTDAGRRHYGVGEKMDTNTKGDSATTKRVKADYNNLSDKEFMQKYHTTKNRYRKRVNKYGDPYARKRSAIGNKIKSVSENNEKEGYKTFKEKRLERHIRKIQEDMDSFKGNENGIRTKNGKLVLSSDDVKSILKGLENEISKSNKKLEAIKVKQNIKDIEAMFPKYGAIQVPKGKEADKVLKLFDAREEARNKLKILKNKPTSTSQRIQDYKDGIKRMNEEIEYLEKNRSEYENAYSKAEVERDLKGFRDQIKEYERNIKLMDERLKKEEQYAKKW